MIPANTAQGGCPTKELKKEFARLRKLVEEYEQKQHVLKTFFDGKM